MDGVELMSCRLKAGGLSIGEVSVEDTKRLVVGGVGWKWGGNLLLLWEGLGLQQQREGGLCGLPDLALPSCLMLRDYCSTSNRCRDGCVR